MAVARTLDLLLDDYFHASRRATFEFLIIFLTFTTAQPTRASLALGLGISVVGVLLRIWTIGYKRRVHHFFVLGPYRFVRHPFYLGTFLLMFGLAVMGGNAWVVAAYLAGICLLYSQILRREEQRLLRLAGPEFQAYQSQVSAFIPQIIPVKAFGGQKVQFSLRQGLFRGGRREVDSLLGLVVGFGLMYGCMVLPHQRWFHIATGIFLLLFVAARVGYYRLRPSALKS